MAFSINTPIGDGSTTQFAVNFVNGIFSRDNVTVFVDGEVDGLGDPVPRAFTWLSDGLIELSGAAPAAGVVIRIRRIMFKDAPIVDYEDGEILIEATLDKSNDQLINLIQEMLDGFGFENIQTDINLNGNKITNTSTDLSDPTSLLTVGGLGDAVERAEDAADLAEADVILADDARIAAQAAQIAAELALDSFDDRELGAKAADPSLDNDGNALAAGTQYFNTVLSRKKVYTGTVWQLTTAFATDVVNTPTGDIAATTVQAAIEELDVAVGTKANQATTYTETEVDDLIATRTESPDETAITASATFTNSTNNIALTGIGSIGLEIGDVVQVTGTASNDKLFTVEVITDVDNLIVNAAHAGGTTTKSLVDETASVTVKLLAKWFNAPLGLGQGIVQVTRVVDTTYTNSTKRYLTVYSYVQAPSSTSRVITKIDGVNIAANTSSSIGGSVICSTTVAVPPDSTYSSALVGASLDTYEVR